MQIVIPLGLAYLAHQDSHRTSCLKFVPTESDMQMAGDIRIQKARARWQRVNQSINAGYTRRNTSSLCSLASTGSADRPHLPLEWDIPQKAHKIEHPYCLVKWSYYIRIVWVTFGRYLFYIYTFNNKVDVQNIKDLEEKPMIGVFSKVTELRTIIWMFMCMCVRVGICITYTYFKMRNLPKTSVLNIVSGPIQRVFTLLKNFNPIKV